MTDTTHELARILALSGMPMTTWATILGVPYSKLYAWCQVGNGIVPANGSGRVPPPPELVEQARAHIVAMLAEL